MARIKKSDRLSKIKAALSYPTASEALAARMAARIAQTAVRPIGEVPIAESDPKHLSAKYQRESLRRGKVSQWLENFREYLSEVVRERAIPERAAKVNPIYIDALPVSASDAADWRNYGPIVTVEQGTTRSKLNAPALIITPEQLRIAASIVRAIPADTISPEARERRNSAQYLLDTESRIIAGKAHSIAVQIARNQSHDLAISATAFNARMDSASAIYHYAPRTNSPYFNAIPSRLGTSRVPLSSLVPLAR